MKVNRQKENAFMIQKLSRNRLERRNTQSTLLLGAGRYMQRGKYTFVQGDLSTKRGLATKPIIVS